MDTMPAQKKPFFARLLEAQHTDSDLVEVIRPPVHTLRYPSDDDEF